MNSHGRALAALLSFALSSTFASETTAEFQIEIVPSENASDSNSAFKAAAPWFRKVLTHGTGLEKNEIIVKTTAPGKLQLTIPESKAPSVGKILKLVAADPELSFCRAHPQSDQLAAKVVAGDKVVPGFRALPFKDAYDDHILVALLPVMTGDSIKSANTIFGPEGFSIQMDFDEKGERIMGTWTEANVGEQLAIVLGDRVLMAPVVRQPFSTGCVISGGKLDQFEAKRLAAIIENPPPFFFKVLETP